MFDTADASVIEQNDAVGQGGERHQTAAPGVEATEDQQHRIAGEAVVKGRRPAVLGWQGTRALLLQRLLEPRQDLLPLGGVLRRLQAPAEGHREGGAQVAQKQQQQRQHRQHQIALAGAVLEQLIEQHRTTLIFVNTRRLAERAAAALAEKLGEAAGCIKNLRGVGYKLEE